MVHDMVLRLEKASPMRHLGDVLATGGWDM